MPRVAIESTTPGQSRVNSMLLPSPSTSSGSCLERREAEQLGQRLAPAHVDQHRSARRDVERVAAFERCVLDDRVAGAFGGRVDHALRAGALRARIASTHSPISAGPR